MSLRTAAAIYAELDTVQHEDYRCRLALRLLERQTLDDVPHLHRQRATLLARRARLKRRRTRLRDEAFRPAVVGWHPAWWWRAARLLWLTGEGGPE